MKTIKVIECNCGEDVYEDDRPQGGSEDELMCIGCGRSWRKDQLQEVEIADITYSPSLEPVRCKK